MKTWHWLLIGAGVYFVFLRKPKAIGPTTGEVAQVASGQSSYALIQKVEQAMAKFGYPPGRIGLEIKTGGAMEFKDQQTGKLVIGAKNEADLNAQLATLA